MPLVGRIDPTLSVLWLAISIVACCLLALRLLRDRRDLGLALAAMGYSFLTAAGRERAWLMPLLVLLLALSLASCMPNPVFDGRATARRYVSRLRRISRP